MKKIAAVLVVAVIALGAMALSGCNAEELKKLGEQAASLTKENADLKDKLATADKDKKAIADQLTALTGHASSEATMLVDMRKTLMSALGQLRFAGQGETEITRILHERRHELARVLSPLAPLVAAARTPLGEALRNLLAALGKTADGG